MSGPLRPPLGMRPRSWLAAIAVASIACACADEQQGAEDKSAEQLAREIEAVAELKPEPEPGELPINLVPLKRVDLAELPRGAADCYLFRGEKIYFATNGEHGILRIDGRPTHVLAAGPITSTGGFFRAGTVRVSIGRRGSYAGAAERFVPGWLAEVAVRAHSKAMAQYAMASWTCRSAGAGVRGEPYALLEEK